MAEIVSADAINNNGSKPISARSRFPDFSMSRAGTYRFGEYGVVDCFDVVPDDKNIRFQSKHNVRSYTMSKPLLQDIKFKKDWFQVALQAILPLNWEKYITNPNIGEDINAELVGASVKDIKSLFSYPSATSVPFFSQLVTRIKELYLGTDTAEPDIYAAFTLYIKYILILNMFYSSGSLASSLGCHLKISGGGSDPDFYFDNIFESSFSYIASYIVSEGYAFSVQWSDGSISIVGSSFSRTNEVDSITLHEFISRAYEDFGFVILDEGFSDEAIIDYALSSDYSSQSLHNIFNIDTYYIPAYSGVLNLEKFFAYQLVCAEFYTNDHVDYIYSAELYRQSMRALLNRIITGSVNTLFSWNGVKYYYDTCSSFMFRKVMEGSVTYSDSQLVLVMEYLRMIFGYNRSLRFVDYFTGSRTQPLAVGDTGVAVNDGYVSVIDTIQQTWFAKFLNQVNRTGRKISEYMRGLFPGLTMQRDYHNPIWLGHTDDIIVSDEVDNTGEAQVSADVQIPITSSLHGNSSRFAFEADFDRYSVVIGICYFDISRFYGDNIQRTFMHLDRFDKFNPFIQFNGDQPVYTGELTGYGDEDVIFGYQGRYMEYKQRVDEAFGGFVSGALPGMIFRADEGRVDSDIQNISPDYIRSYPSELDKFYKSLTGYSLANYFHFIVINYNDIDGSRPMVYNPQLG